jgi:trehalose 6-phosphate synthase/phosphatase
MPIKLENQSCNRRVIICSSTLPITLVENENGQLVAKPRHNHPAWLAGLGITKKVFIGTASNELSESERIAFGQANCIPVPIDQETLTNFIGYCKERLWPLLHYHLWDRPLLDVHYEKALFSAFESVNRAFADVVMSVLEPGDIVLAIDCHLLLLPAEIRRQCMKTPIGLFIVTPVSSSEYIRCLPQSRQVLSGAVGANLVFFQTDSYTRHFASCCVRILNLDKELMEKGLKIVNGDVSMLLRTAPLGVDVQKVRELKTCYGVMEKVNEIRRLFPPELALIVGIDRADQTRGIKHKLDALDLFLKTFPEWIGKVLPLNPNPK